MPVHVHSGGHVSAADTKTILNPVVSLVLNEITDRGHKLVFAQAQQIVAAAFGFHTLKHLLESDARIIERRSTTGSPQSDYQQYRGSSVERRFKRLFPDTSDIEAMQIGIIVSEHLRNCRLVIDAQTTFFNPESQKSKRILSALAADHKHFEPVNASVAMHAGLLPKLDKSMFLSLSSKAGPSKFAWPETKGIVERISAKKLHLLVGVLPDYANFAIPYIDVYRGPELRYARPEQYAKYAEMGSGFCLVSESFHFSDRIHTTLYSSHAYYRVIGGWSSQWQTAGFDTYLSTTNPFRNLSRPRLNLSNCPLVQYCPACDQIYVENGPKYFAHTGCSH